METSDLFAPDAEWDPFLKLDFWWALQLQGWTPPDDNAKQFILEAATDPSNWLLTRAA
ncbi:hypothetical protein ACFJGW_14665 [Burkholderiaceae bacterium UC74_6]